MKKFPLIFFCTVSVFFFLTSFSQAQDAASDEYMNGSLLSAQDAAGTLTTLPMALALDLEDEWYIYWRMPGDGGLPTTFDWSQSKNISDVKISWPTPSRITAADLNSFGYKNAVLFPLEVIPQKPGDAVTLSLKVNAVACHEICVPQEITVMRTLPAHDPAGTADKEKIAAAIAALPSKENSETLNFETAVLGKDAIAVPVYAKNGINENMDVVVETPNSLLTRRPEIIRDKTDPTRAVLKVKAPDGVDLTKELFGKKTGILLINGDDAVERDFSF